MMTEKTPLEPSMDEILASIRQLISSDTKESQPFFPEGEVEDILDLTHAYFEDHEKAYPINSLPDMNFPERGESPSNTNQQNWPNKEKDIHNPFQPSPQHPVFVEDALLSQETVSETTHAFHLLNKNIQEKQAAPDSHHQEGPGGQALENLMREMLRPLLKEWLDIYLPSIVRSIVAEQVDKIVQQANGGSGKTMGK